MKKSKVKSQKNNSKLKHSRMLNRAIDFHGHLGPYLVLGMLMGDLAINKLKCKKHFGVRVIVRGALNRPKSCLIDGIQISAGCTYGKGNIKKINGKKIEVFFENLANNKKLRVFLQEDLITRLNSLSGHRPYESFARQLLKIRPEKLFQLKF
jgi:formylmethanofuran dehydrogenase subunit E